MPSTFLPTTPRKAKSRRLVKKLITAFLLFLLGLAMLGGLGAYSVVWTQDLLHDRALFASGEKATFGGVEGTQRSRKFFFHEYDLTLTYLDAKGGRHTAKQEFISVGDSVDEKQDPEIRYDPANPDRASSSWSVDVTFGRVIWSLLAFAISLIGGFVIYAVYIAARDGFLEQTAAKEGVEIRLEVSEHSRDQHGNVTYVLRAEPNAGDVIKGQTTLNKSTPLWLGERMALGLYLPEKRRIFLVESDGQPVDLSEAELWDLRKGADVLASTKIT